MRTRKALYLLDCYLCGTETFKTIRTKKPRCYNCAFGYKPSWSTLKQSKGMIQ